MHEAAVVDASVMQGFLEEYLLHVTGPARQLVEGLHGGIGFAVDSGGKIKHEWFATCENPFFREWYLAALYQGKIKEVQETISHQHKKAIHQLGLPQNSYDKFYISTANATLTRYIVAKDIDYYDPCLKHADDKAKCRARDDRKGKLCKYLRKEMNIRVGTPVHALAELLGNVEVA